VLSNGLLGPLFALSDGSKEGEVAGLKAECGDEFPEATRRLETQL